MVTTVADLGDGVGDALDVLELATAVLNRNLEMLRRRTDVYTDLDRAEYLVLRTLVQFGQADIGSLAAALGVDPSTAGRQVAGLEARGLIDRTAAEDDRRRSIVAPTDEGRRRTDLTRRRRRTATADMLSDWTADELRRLGELLTRYNKAVADRYLTR
ncbi:MAG TPA: MarR family transcriptional regulator [Pseudonocardiaceae bacterium]|jgi:DNA-binding MarR family transcriptional regulator|nr:MarR family transcriptional regulator [Pseudonocardiaceae bacterium]